jgi:hypothetical protein
VDFFYKIINPLDKSHLHLPFPLSPRPFCPHVWNLATKGNPKTPTHDCNECCPKMKQGVCHIMPLPFTLKKYHLNAKKEELWKLKYYFTMQKYNLQKKIL